MEPGLTLHPASKSDTMACPKDYRSKVGTLMYAMINTRPDLAYSVGQLSMFNQEPTMDHAAAAKRVYQYVQATHDQGIQYRQPSNGEPLELKVYVDASYASTHDRRSISAYLIFMCGGPISWKSKRQSVVAISSTEAEYIALAQAVQEVIWLRQLLKDLGHEIKTPTIIYEDNQACINLANNPVAHGRTKHIDVKYHFLREKLMEGTFTLQYCQTKEMIADALTKSLPKLQHGKFKNEMVQSVFKGKELEVSPNPTTVMSSLDGPANNLVSNLVSKMDSGSVNWLDEPQSYLKEVVCYYLTTEAEKPLSQFHGGDTREVHSSHDKPVKKLKTNERLDQKHCSQH